MLISVPEGHDKPIKYPKAIKTSQVLLVTKSDIVEHFDFDIEKIKKDALALNPSIKVLVTSAKTGEGLDGWFELLKLSINS